MFPRAVGIRLGGFFFHYEAAKKRNERQLLKMLIFRIFRKFV